MASVDHVRDDLVHKKKMKMSVRCVAKRGSERGRGERQGSPEFGRSWRITGGGRRQNELHNAQSGGVCVRVLG